MVGFKIIVVYHCVNIDVGKCRLNSAKLFLKMYYNGNSHVFSIQFMMEHRGLYWLFCSKRMHTEYTVIVFSAILLCGRRYFRIQKIRGPSLCLMRKTL